MKGTRKTIEIKPDSAARPAYSVFDVTPYEQKTGKKMPDWRDGLAAHLAASIEVISR